MKKKYSFLIIFFYLSIVLYGFAKVNNSLPNFIKERSNFSIYCKQNPFDFRIETKDYTFKVNSKTFLNIKKGIKNFIP
ncbi:hypothetical protein CLOACE_03880 [Clostridium acetireducens DSM 10703]|jgi:hypothetical protein|uniref:Uncharacterized protein n=1 Tax=Clostridium acetireducens DSM 10703 TaxID=1121290 RepID=A0A1E8F158_9CLOT|nr:hypothetical protein [Clostridium acetireducens]OFI07197.1 hypothetical protein CLOACE_03880 [Clostridium acetireducens DSM 10703]